MTGTSETDERDLLWRTRPAPSLSNLEQGMHDAEELMIAVTS